MRSLLIFAIVDSLLKILWKPVVFKVLPKKVAFWNPFSSEAFEGNNKMEEILRNLHLILISSGSCLNSILLLTLFRICPKFCQRGRKSFLESVLIFWFSFVFRFEKYLGTIGLFFILGLKLGLWKNLNKKGWFSSIWTQQNSSPAEKARKLKYCKGKDYRGLDAGGDSKSPKYLKSFVADLLGVFWHPRLKWDFGKKILLNFLNLMTCSFFF